MKYLSLLFCLLLAFPALSQSNYCLSDLKAGNFNLQNRQLVFEKEYNNPMAMTILEKKIKSLNSVNSGMQVKSLTDHGLNGVMIRYPLDWTAPGFKSRKISKFLKLPVNAIFEVKSEENSYKVRITGIWFSNTINPGSEQHLALENMVLIKNGFAISKKKKTLRALSILDENLEQMFRGKPNSW